MLDELMNGDGSPKRIRVVADPAGKQVLVTARALDLLTIAAIVEKLDTPSERK